MFESEEITGRSAVARVEGWVSWRAGRSKKILAGYRPGETGERQSA